MSDVDEYGSEGGDADDGGNRGAADKLIPEWSAGADHQILVIGLVALAALLLAWGWRIFWVGDDSAGTDGVRPNPSSVVEEDSHRDAAGTTMRNATSEIEPVESSTMTSASG